MSNKININIEKATKNDINEIFSLEQLCFQGDAFSKRQFKYLIEKANGEFVVVRINKKIIAYFVFLKRINSNYYRIYSIAIHPGSRGLGIAKKLLDYAEEQSIKNKIHKIHLEVSEHNEAAISLYKKLKYQVVGLKPGYYSDGSTALIMGKVF